MEFDLIPFLSFSFSTATLARLAFYLVVLFVGITSAILFFHWRRYGLSKGVIAVTETIYFSVCVLLVGAAFLALP